MRLLVCGGRHYNNRALVFETLDALAPQPTVLINGGATGADTLARIWAAARAIPIELYPAKWDAYGKAAGYIRNLQMITEGDPDLVIAFPGNLGTRDMVLQSIKAGIEVREVSGPSGPALRHIERRGL